MDTFSHTYNTQRDNANAVLTNEKLDKSGDLAEMLKDLTINDVEYYVSSSENTNDTKGCPASDPKTFTHTSDGKKIKVTDTSNGILQQKLLINQTLPFFTTKIDPRIYDRIVTCGGTPCTPVMPVTKEIILDVVCSSVQVN